MPAKVTMSPRDFRLYVLTFRDELDHCLRRGHWHAAGQLLNMLASVLGNHAPHESRESWELGRQSVMHAQALVLDWLAFMRVEGYEPAPE